VPVLRKPAIVIDGIVGDFSVEVHARHTAGSYFVIAALAVIALALAVAVRGRVLPHGVDVEQTVTAAETVWPAPQQLGPEEEMLTIPADTPAVAIDFGTPAPPAADPPSADESVIEPPDHSMYVRPTSTVVPRR
jgi:hypothetical protein